MSETLTTVNGLPQLTPAPASGTAGDAYNQLSTAVATALATIPAAQVQSDWDATSGVAEILNKPTIPTLPTLATVATSGSYTDLSNTPTIPTLPTLATVATSGSYTDLSNKPTIPTLPTLATVATSGSYTDLSNKPTIPPPLPADAVGYLHDDGSGNLSWQSVSGGSTLPTDAAGVLTDDGSGNLSWTALSQGAQPSSPLAIPQLDNEGNLTVWGNVTAANDILGQATVQTPTVYTSTLMLNQSSLTSSVTGETESVSVNGEVAVYTANTGHSGAIVAGTYSAVVTAATVTATSSGWSITGPYQVGGEASEASIVQEPTNDMFPTGDGSDGTPYWYGSVEIDMQDYNGNTIAFTGTGIMGQGINLAGTDNQGNYATATLTMYYDGYADWTTVSTWWGCNEQDSNGNYWCPEITGGGAWGESYNTTNYTVKDDGQGNVGDITWQNIVGSINYGSGAVVLDDLNYTMNSETIMQVVSSYSYTSATPTAGEIVFDGSHYYGANGSNFLQLDN